MRERFAQAADQRQEPDADSLDPPVAAAATYAYGSPRCERESESRDEDDHTMAEITNPRCDIDPKGIDETDVRNQGRLPPPRDQRNGCRGWPPTSLLAGSAYPTEHALRHVEFSRLDCPTWAPTTGSFSWLA